MAFISLDDVSIDIPVFNADSRSIRKTVIGFGGTGRLSGEGRHVNARALNHLSLELRDGDRVGLVGLNGAGKTTLLRALAGVYPPTSGRIAVEGRIASLFDASLGLDPESTGYENILLKGLHLGLSKAEIEHKMDDIVAFTELEDYLALPVRTYSAGMSLRLAFAVITSINPDIILMDEWLGVGDAVFLEKARRRLEEFVSRSRIMVLASHSEDLIRSVCNRAVLMNQGNIVNDGDVNDIYAQYNLFGPQPFFEAEAYLQENPDVRESVENGAFTPWVHFISWGFRERRNIGNGIALDHFMNDPEYLDAVAREDEPAAIRRIMSVAPFLATTRLPPNWKMPEDTPIPLDFVPPDGVTMRIPRGVRVPEGVDLPAYFIEAGRP
jgi:ABC-2 type transport system ATP-binding protein/lipopolysaccharide transport system ATP-binding protein